MMWCDINKSVYGARFTQVYSGIVKRYSAITIYIGLRFALIVLLRYFC